MADHRETHADHDPLLIASLVDDDLPADDRALAQTWIAACPDCRSLSADLVALSTATRTQPTPDRPRDFRLTAADAARLRAEPSASSARLTDVMTDRPATSSHASHDTTLVASLADHSLAPTERAAAEELVASCSACAALHADLVTLVAATRAMPTPHRPIDYTLTQAQAARLRPNPWRRLVAAVGSSRDGFTRPLAIGLSTLGLVALLITSAPSILQFQGGSATSTAGGEATQPITAPGLSDTTGEPAPGAAAAPAGPNDGAISASVAPERAAMTPSPVYGVTNAGPIPGASAATQTDANGKGTLAGGAEASASPVESTADLTATVPSSGIDPVVLVSAALLLVGLGLFVLRWSARRLGDG